MQTASEEPGNFLCNDSPCGKEHAFREAEELQGKWQQDLGLQSLSEHMPGQYRRDSALPTTGNTALKHLLHCTVCGTSALLLRTILLLRADNATRACGQSTSRDQEKTPWEG